MFDPLGVFRFCVAEQQAGQRVVLVTAIRVEGPSSRDPGTHMAVAEDGSAAGSFSGGCIEPSIVAEALEAMREGAPRKVLYGAGSPYIDIRLPCGGAIELLFTPMPDAAPAQAVVDLLEARQPVAIRLDSGESGLEISEGSGVTGVVAEAGGVSVQHVPPLRLVILGTGEVVERLAILAQSAGLATAVATPQPSLLERLAGHGAELLLLEAPTDPLALAIDRWTAAAALFHDHDWEPPLLAQLLTTSAFFVGAMGSRQTHQARLARLAEAGVDPADAARIVSPIGLIPAMRDPETLAVSVLAQVVAVYSRRFLSMERG
jgi:xanthine dehydrogenase accessory factor